MTGPPLTVPTAHAPNEYQSILDADRGTAAQRLETSTAVAGRAMPDPDRTAKVLTLAGQTKLPAGVVDRNFDTVRAAQTARSTDYQQILDDTPGLAHWLGDPHNAALARDEVPQLQQVHRGVDLLSRVPDPSALEQQLTMAGATGLSELDAAAGHLLVAFGRVSPEDAAAHVANANRTARDLRAMAPDYVGDFQRSMATHGNDVDAAARDFSAHQASERRLAVLNVLLGLGGTEAADLAKPAARTVGQVLSLIAAAAVRPRGLTYATVEGLASSAPALAAGYGGAMAGAAAGSVVPGVGTAIGGAAGLAGGTFLGAAPVAVGSAINAELQQRGVDVTDVHSLVQAFNDPTLMAAVRSRAERQGITSAAVQALFASFAGKIALASKGAGAVKAVAGTVADASTQAAGMAAAEAAGQVAADKSTANVSLGKAAETGVQMLGYGFGEAAVGSSMRSILHADPIEAAQQATIQAFDALRAEQHGQALAEIGAAIKDAPATAQVPDRLKQLVETATGGNDNAQVYFQSKDWDEFWQARGASPAKAASDILGDDGRAYYAAKATGSRLVIPIADYIAKVAPTDAWEGLLPHARTSVDGLSLGEARDYLKALPATLTELAAEATREPASAPEPAATVGERVHGLLTDAGIPAAQAKAHAALYESAFRSFGERAGVDPLELFNRYALEVTNDNAPARKPTAEPKPLAPAEVEARANLQAAAESALERAGLGNEEVTAKGTYDLPAKERDVTSKDDAGFYTYARTEAGTLRANLGKVSVEGLVDELARLIDANSEDGMLVVPTVSAEANVSHVDGSMHHHVGMKGAAINASGRIAARNKSIAKLEAHLADRGVPDVDERLSRRLGERAGQFGDTVYEQSALDGWNEAQMGPKPTREELDAIQERSARTLLDKLPRAAALPEEHGQVLPKAFRLWQDARGRIRIGENRHMTIDLLKDADRSTFLHETGHFYLEVLGDLAKAPDPAAGVRADYAAIRTWVGAEGDAPLTRDQHEQVARGFEAYLMEGTAPSTALAEAFQRFRTWLVGIYHRLRALQVTLTPEVRQVFDRMLATDAELKAAERTQAVEPLFPDPKAVGLSDAQAETYSRAVVDARRTAEEEVTRRVMKELTREESAQWKAWRAPILEKVTADVNARPEYRALAFLKDGTHPDGTPLEAGTPAWKLEREAIAERYPELSLPESLTARADRGGMDPDIAAEVFGFDSGRDLVEALAKAPAKDKLIGSLVDAQLRETHGERMSEPDLKAAAQKAVRGEKRAAVLRKELEILASDHMAKLKGLVRAIAKPVPPTEVIRAEAAKIVGMTSITELKPIVYERAARTLATQAREALLRGDVEAAFDAKRKELLTNEVFRATSDAREAIDTALDEFKKVFRSDERVSRTRDLDLVNAARAILSSFGIGRTDKPATAYLEQIRKYDQETYETVESMVSAATTNAGDYRRLSYDDFRALRETVSSLWTLSRRTRQIEIDGQRLDRQTVQSELIAHLLTITKPGERPGDTKAVTATERQLIGLAGVGAALRRAEHWVREVDGGDAGVFRRYLLNPIMEAGTAFRVAKLEVMTKYAELVKPLEGTVTREKIKAPELGYTFDGKRELLGALLHRGNESNLSKLLRGRGWGSTTETGALDSSRWDAFETRMQQAGILTKADYDFVQSVWDLFDELKAPAQKAHKELYGHYFAEVTAKPFETPFGSYDGGYFPAKADPFMVPESGRQAEATSVLQSDNSSLFPSTGRGFTKSRVEAYAKPLIMDASKIPTHIDAVLRFTHINPHVADVARLIRSRELAETLDHYSPVAIEGLLDPWLRRTAQQAIDTPSRGRGGKWIDDTARWLRRNAGMQILSASATVAVEQLTHLPTLAVRVSATGLARGLWEFTRSPKGSVEAIHARSEYMKTRASAGMMEVRKAIDHILLDPTIAQKSGAWLNEHAAFLTRAIQHVEDHVAWSAAYGDALARGLEEREAVRHADATVRETLGAYEPESISKFEASAPVVKLISMFYSFFNTKANFMKTEVSTVLRDDTGFASKATSLAGVYMAAWLVPAVMATLIKSQLGGESFDKNEDGPWDDVLDLFWKSQLDQGARLVPIAGPLLQGALQHFGAGKGPDVVSSPAFKTLQDAFNTPGDVAHAIHDRMITHKEITDLFTLIGLVTGTPARPLAKPIGYLHDRSTGQTTSSGAFDVTRGLVTGAGRSR